LKRDLLRSWVCVVSLGVMVAAAAFAGSATSAPHSLKAMPYEDSRYHGGAQKIPGRVMCAYYDVGGEGVAYHDSDAKNSGSGGLNPADGTYLNEFRIHEAVDTSYTKYHDDIDNNPFEKVHPPEGLLYVGWTEAGEWFKITVDATRAGAYTGDLLYTSNRGGTISIDVNGEDVTGPVTIRSTFNKADPIAWRQWHHWDVAKGLVMLKLPKGKSVLTVHILTEGNMNLAYFDFHQGLAVQTDAPAARSARFASSGRSR
jgi:hypothetical protein